VINMNFSPPPVAHDAATQIAQVYLAAAIDPAATRARLEELDTATKAYRDAIAEHAAVSATAAEVATAQEVVTAHEQAVAAREAALRQRQTQIDVAAAALGERESAVKTRELAADDREAALARDTAGLAARIESYKAALSA
jgi:hypothetical protein